MPNVPAPTGGLGSNSNYVFTNGGNPILDLTVSIDITADLISNIGFSFQLNAYSPAGDLSAWQQFILQFDTPNGLPPGQPGTLYGQVEPWPNTTAGTGPETTGGDLINNYSKMIVVQDSDFRIGYRMSIALGNDGNNVRYVTFTVVDNLGNSTSTGQLDISKLPLDPSGTATTKDIAPIIA